MEKNKKHYHKGIRCQLGFHKWEKVGTRIVMGGKAGELVAKICERCGDKSNKGHFIAEPIKKDEAVTIQINKPKLSPYADMYNRKAEIKLPNGARFLPKEGWVIENGVKRKMTDDDIKKLEKEMGEAMGEIGKIMKAMGGNMVPMTPKNFHLTSLASRVNKKNVGIDNLMYCTCESGEWNKLVSRCKACNRRTRT